MHMVPSLAMGHQQYVINPVRPSDAMWRKTYWATLTQVKACRVFDVSGPMLTYYQRYFQEHLSLKLESK